ncbi:hypothetical protein HY933_04270 [Candidatus Falkowbacteria bacterium]|nr:hypothetical protein [Candidatus Falkowbacteria bacterium]
MEKGPKFKSDKFADQLLVQRLIQDLESVATRIAELRQRIQGRQERTGLDGMTEAEEEAFQSMEIRFREMDAMLSEYLEDFERHERAKGPDRVIH